MNMNMLMLSDIEKLLTGELNPNNNNNNSNNNSNRINQLNSNNNNTNTDFNYRMGTNIDISGIQPGSSSGGSAPRSQLNSMNSMNSTSFDMSIYSPDSGLYMPGTASLIQDVDKQLMVILRDGRTLIGYLRSIDQYANLLLSNTFERIHVGNKYGDIPRGIYIVRGENVVLIGEVDFDQPTKVPLIKVSENDILELQKIEQKKQEDIEKNKKRALLNSCLLPQSDSILDDYY